MVGLSKQQKKDLFAMLSQIKKQLEVEIASDGEKKNRKGKGKIMHVLKTLLAQVKEFTRDSILTPIFYACGSGNGNGHPAIDGIHH